MWRCMCGCLYELMARWMNVAMYVWMYIWVNG